MYLFFVHISVVTKRLLDIFMSLSGLILLSPFLVLVAFLVRINLGSPILFTQYRPGLNGRLFALRKFRSMRNLKEGQPMLETDADRATKFGTALRKTSLDELPELWNILVGEMSFVGPRPLLKEYLPRYSKEQFRRHLVRPGLTGLAQVQGRNLVDWDERFRLDVWYVDHWSLVLDFKIIIQTFSLVLTARGVNGKEQRTMSEFRGNHG